MNTISGVNSISSRQTKLLINGCFTKLDKDRDGQLSIEPDLYELTDIDPFQASISDADHDGKLNEQELSELALRNFLDIEDLYIKTYRSFRSLIDDSLPKEIKRSLSIRSWAEYECTDFRGNTQIEEADIICLGDNHSVFYDDARRFWLLEVLAKDGDLILVEGVEANELIDKKDHDWTSLLDIDVSVRGWDNQGLREQIANMQKELDGLGDFSSQLYSEADSLNDVIQEYCSNPRNVALYFLTHLIIPQPHGARDEYQQELYQKASEIAMLNSIVARLQNIQYHTALFDRDKSLIRTIEENRTKMGPGQKIFVLAGSAHFQEDNEVLNYLGKERYVILIPKTDF